MVGVLTDADIIPIPGTKRVKYLEANAGALDFTFSQNDNERIWSMVETVGGVKGARYAAATMSMCFGDSPELAQD